MKTMQFAVMAFVLFVGSPAIAAGMWGEGAKTLKGIRSAKAEVLVSMGDLERVHADLPESELQLALEKGLAVSGVAANPSGGEAKVLVRFVLSAIYLQKLDHFIFDYSLEIWEEAELPRGIGKVRVVTYQDPSGPCISPAAEFKKNILGGLSMKLLMLKSNLKAANRI